MKNLYKVTLYEIEKYKKAEAVGTIIVEEGIFAAKEVITNQKIRIYSKVEYADVPKAGRKNLFLVSGDFCNKNIVNVTEALNYVDNFKLGVRPYSEIIKAKKTGLILTKKLR